MRHLHIEVNCSFLRTGIYEKQNEACTCVRMLSNVSSSTCVLLPNCNVRTISFLQRYEILDLLLHRANRRARDSGLFPLTLTPLTATSTSPTCTCCRSAGRVSPLRWSQFKVPCLACMPCTRSCPFTYRRSIYWGNISTATYIRLNRESAVRVSV